MNESPRDPRTHQIIGAAMEVHRRLGHGFLEAVYHEALAIELELAAIPTRHEVLLPIHYRERILQQTYRADCICFGEIIVELKALTKLSTNEEAQLLNYLKATGHETGLLINFGAPSLEFKRMIFTRKNPPQPPL